MLIKINFFNQVVNPNDFWVAHKNSITEQNEKDIFVWLNAPDADIIPFIKSPQVDDLCAAPYKVDNDYWLYRAKIIELVEENLVKVR